MSRAARILFALMLVCIHPASDSAIGAEPAHVRLGLVKYGSGAWEIDTIRRHGFDRSAGIVIDTVDVANPAAGEVALQAGAVDAIITDWLWVARQRHTGQQLTFVPHNAVLGDILVPPASSVHTLADLKGLRIGVAGGPYDKSWLLVRAYSRRHLGYDIAEHADLVYGAPPLLSQELEAGRLDAVLTYWPFAARLSVQRYRTLVSMAEILTGLGLTNPVPMMGFGFAETWAKDNPQALKSFLAAAQEADAVMVASDDEWRQLRPLTAAENDAVLISLRDRFRRGVVANWTPPEKTQAIKLFALLTETGGADLTGGAKEIPPGTFWDGFQP